MTKTRKRRRIKRFSECNRPDDDATDEIHRQRAQKNATHSFSPSLRVFVWSFVVLSSHYEREEKRKHSSGLNSKIIEITCDVILVFDIRDRRGRREVLRSQKNAVKRTLYSHWGTTVFGGRRCFIFMGHQRRVSLCFKSEEKERKRKRQREGKRDFLKEREKVQNTKHRRKMDEK